MAWPIATKIQMHIPTVVHFNLYPKKDQYNIFHFVQVIVTFHHLDIFRDWNGPEEESIFQAPVCANAMLMSEAPNDKFCIFIRCPETNSV